MTARTFARSLRPFLVALALVIARLASAQSAPPSGLIAHWALDAGSGTTASDSVGTQHGTLTNGPTWTTGQHGGAVSFDGTDDYIALPSLDVTGSTVTFAMWVRSTSLSNAVDQRFLAKSSGVTEQDHYWMVGHTYTGEHRLRFRLKAGGTTTTLVATSGTLPLNTWYHVAATYDGAAMRLYLDGVEVGSVAKTGALATSGAVPVNIGRNPDDSNYIVGAIDDVRIYDRALSASEIATVMTGGTTPPSISSLSPASGIVGQAVTIAGSNFGATQGTSTVAFNGTPASVSSWSADTITAIVPAGEATGPVVVTVNGVASNGLPFTVVAAPVISSLSPDEGIIGQVVTISGTGFGQTQGTSIVDFNGTNALASNWSNTSIMVTVPTNVATGPVRLIVGGQASNAVTFTVVAPPSISSLSPASGAIGASVTIAGANFGATQGSSTISFNGTSATATSWSELSLVVTVPVEATTGPVTVSVGGQVSNGATFTVIEAPVISSVSPASGPVGESVTITGSNFGAVPGTSTVTFNGVEATPTNWTPTSMSMAVPADAATGPVVVTVGEQASNSVTFTVVPAPLGAIVWDTFTGADATSLSSRAPDVAPSGASWVNEQGGATTLLGNRVAVGVTSGYTLATIDSGISNGATSADLVWTASYAYGGVVFRAVDVNSNLLLRFAGSSSSAQVGLFRRVAGDFSLIKEVSVPPIAPNIVHRIEARYSGTTVQAVWDGTVLFSEPVTDYQTATRSGVLWHSDDLSMQFDNFEVRPADLLSDSFSGSSAPLTSHAPDVAPPGTTWSMLQGAAPTVDNGVLSGATGTAYTIATIDLGLGNGTIGVDVQSTSSTPYAGLVLRAVDGDNLLALRFAGTPTSGRLELFRRVNGVFELLAGVAVGAITVGSTHRIEARLAGPSIGAVWDGREVFNVAVTNYQVATRHGVLWSLPGDATTTYDNFSFTSYVAIPTLSIGTVCEAGLSPAALNLPNGNQTAIVTVSIPSACRWQAPVIGSENWYSTDGPQWRVGPGIVQWVITNNTNSAPVFGQTTIAGHDYMIYQAGTGGATCGYSASPSSLTFTAVGGTQSLSVTKTGIGSCYWAPLSRQGWATLSTGAVQTGDATLTVTVPPNTTGVNRNGTFVFGTLSVPILQTGAAAVNGPPVVTAPGTQTHVGGTSVSVAIVASDPEGQTLTYSASGLPPGLTVNATTGLITGSLGTLPSQLGTYTVTARASDGTTATPREFTWTVTAPPPPPPYAQVYDTFSGPGGPLTAHVSELAPGSWTLLSGSATATVVNGAAQAVTPTWMGITTTVANGSVAADFRTTGPNTWAGVLFRVQDSTNALALVHVGSWGTARLRLYRIQNGLWELLEAVSVAPALSGTHRIEARFSGSSVTAVFDGLAVFEETVTAYTSATTHGLVWSPTVDASAAIESFSVTNGPYVAPLPPGTRCQAGLSRTVLPIPTDASTLDGRLEVTMPHPSCQWAMRMLDAAGFTLPGSGIGTGSGTVEFAWENFWEGPHTAHATVAGALVTLSQVGTNGYWCDFALSRADLEYPSQGGTDTVTVTPNGPNCKWAASDETVSDDITLSDGALHDSAATIAVTVAPNPALTDRVGYLKLGTFREFPIEQVGDGCAFTVAPTQFANVNGEGDTLYTYITIPNGCGWEAWSLTPSMIDEVVLPSPNPSGNGEIRFRVLNNPQPGIRLGYLHVGKPGYPEVLVAVSQCGSQQCQGGGGGGPSSGLPAPNGQDPGGPVSYLHTDALGSVRMVTDEQGNEVRYDYLPFGEPWGNSGTSTLQFTGKERDTETQFGGWNALDYFGARYYQGQTGRFTTVDPIVDIEQSISEPQRWNRYEYGLNNPLKFTDPDGRLPILAIIPIVYSAIELGMSIYDAYTVIQTVRDPNASKTEKSVTAGGFVAGIVLPGGGYGTAGRAIVRYGDDLASGFHSFTAFKRAFGAAGPDMEWHHIVEQTASNVGRFGAEAIHSAKNVIRLPTTVHRKISAYYSSKQPFTKGLTVREWLRTQSLEEQERFGRELLEELAEGQ